MHARGGVGGASGAILIGLASALTFALSGSLMKPLLEAGWSLGIVGFMRMAGAALLLSPLLVHAVRTRGRALLPHWRLFLGFGLLGVAGTQLFYLAAISRLPVGVALLIEFTAPVLLVAFAWARTRIRPAGMVLAGSAVSLAGLLCIIDLAGASFDLIGTLFALASAVCVGGYFVFSAKAGDEVPPLTLVSGGLMLSAIVVGLAGAVGVLPFVAGGDIVHFDGVAVPWAVPVVLVIIVSTVIPYTLGVIAASRLGARVSSFLGLSEAMFAVLLAWILLGEAPSVVQAIGGALILTGIVLVRAERRREVVTVPDVPIP